MRKRPFAAKLRAIRSEAGLTRYALAKKAGLSLQAIIKLEMGKNGPTWTTIQKLAQALEVSPEAFMEPITKAKRT
jgi:transcriptional regulator with XRE-family HTH domain